MSSRHVSKHEEVVPASISCEDPADRLVFSHSSWSYYIIILMADCNPERIMCL